MLWEIENIDQNGPNSKEFVLGGREQENAVQTLNYQDMALSVCRLMEAGGWGKGYRVGFVTLFVWKFKSLY